MKGKNALITGAAKRIGKAIAYRFAKETINVAIHYNTSGKKAEELRSRLEDSGVTAWTFQADLSQPKKIDKFFEHVISVTGGINYLVNNASIFPEDRLTTFTPGDFFTNIRINALSPLLLSRKFAEQKRKGKIINLLDTRITSYDTKHAAYHLSKRMLYELTKIMALEFAPGITVNAVAPGLILPPPGKDTGYLEKMVDTNPLQAYGTVDEIAGAVMFLIKTEFVTGQVIYVDGGRHLKGCVYNT